MEHVQKKLDVSQRLACRVLGQYRSAQRYEHRLPNKDRDLTEKIRRLAAEYPRFGYRRIAALLRREGVSVNVKRVHRIWKCEKLEVVRKKLKPRRKAHGRNSVTRLKPEYSGHVWSYDFVHGRTEDGRKLRFLTVVDEFTREALAIEVGRSFGAKKVVATLRKVTLVRGFPDHLRSDNGGEFVAEVVKAWLTKAGVNTLFIDPGSPWQNAYIESFNGKFRDEFLDRDLPPKFGPGVV